MSFAQTEQAVYRYGSQLNVPYTNGATALAAGEVVDLGNFVGIALEPIAALANSSLCLTGVFEILKETGTALNFGDMILWAEDTDLAFKTSGYTDDAAIGPCVKAAASGDATVFVLLNPYHTAVTG